MTRHILILGGYGTFGGRLTRRLAPAFEVIVAGRDGAKAAVFCAEHGGSPLALERTEAGLAARVASLAPFAVIDAAGPFQAYGAAPYALAEAAIAAGAHYLDLSDDAAFTAGISRLDEAARAAGVVVLSGASSVPALSSAAVDELADGLADIHLIEGMILPGNRAPRGLSVIRAIVAQVGRPLALWRGGEWQSVAGWSGRVRTNLEVPGHKVLRGRSASYIGAPDLALFAARYRARSVTFRAGLELAVMHRWLGALGWLVRFGVMRALTPLAKPLKWFADRLERFGSDRGGMSVRVLGITPEGQAVARHWTLIAEAGDGPFVPVLAAQILCGKLADIAPGARPCLGVVTLAELADVAGDLQIGFGRGEQPFGMIFEGALGPDFAALPAPLQDLHRLIDRRNWQGAAEVRRGTGLLSKIICAVVGFPPAAENVPVRVEMERQGAAEHWLRQFGTRRFRSVLRPAGPGRVSEQFGAMRFTIALAADGVGLRYPVVAGRLWGLPLPRVLLPRSEAIEAVDAEARATFDVALSLPMVGLLVHYRGWLAPLVAQIGQVEVISAKTP